MAHTIVLLPPGALKRLSQLNVMFPMFFRISATSVMRKAFCGVLEFVAEEDTCCLPDWMMKQLGIEDGTRVLVTNVKLPKGTFMKIQPFATKFTELPNPKAMYIFPYVYSATNYLYNRFEHALSSYACLAVNDVITIAHGGENYSFEILECKPGPEIGVIDTDIALEFVPAKDYDPKKPAKPLEKTEEIQGIKEKFPGKGVQVSEKRKRLAPFPSESEDKEVAFDPRAHRITYVKADAGGKSKKDSKLFKGKSFCVIDEVKKFKADN